MLSTGILDASNAWNISAIKNKENSIKNQYEVCKKDLSSAILNLGN